MAIQDKSKHLPNQTICKAPLLCTKWSVLHPKQKRNNNWWVLWQHKTFYRESNTNSLESKSFSTYNIKCNSPYNTRPGTMTSSCLVYIFLSLREPYFITFPAWPYNDFLLKKKKRKKEKELTLQPWFSNDKNIRPTYWVFTMYQAPYERIYR